MPFRLLEMQYNIMINRPRAMAFYFQEKVAGPPRVYNIARRRVFLRQIFIRQRAFVDFDLYPTQLATTEPSVRAPGSVQSIAELLRCANLSRHTPTVQNIFLVLPLRQI